jgi:hypothetical protein
LFIEVSKKAAHEKIKQALRFQVGQKERELTGGDESSAAAAATVAHDATDKGDKKTRTIDRSSTSYPPLKKRKVKSLPSTMAPEHVQQKVVFDPTASSGLSSSLVDQTRSPPNFNLLPRSTTMRTASFLSDHQAVDRMSTWHQMLNNESINWPLATAHSSQPSVFFQLSREERPRLSTLAVLSAASSTTTRQPVDIQDLQGRQPQVLTLKEQVAVAHQQQHSRTSSMLSELLLHQKIKEQLEREVAAQASASRPTSGSVQGARQIGSEHLLQHDLPFWY